MSILNPTSNTPAQQAASQILAIPRMAFQQLGTAGIRGYNLLWNNPRATPEDIFTALGTDAQKVLGFAGINITAVQSAAELDGISPPAIPEIPSNYTLTMNDDGSITPVKSSASSSSSGGTQSRK
jgi:hypothetical protein